MLLARLSHRNHAPRYGRVVALRSMSTKLRTFLSNAGLNVGEVIHNAPPALLIEDAVKYDGGVILNSGALRASSNLKTGRSATDKRLVKEPNSADVVDWEANKPMTPAAFLQNRQRGVDYLNSKQRIYVVDGFAGHSKEFRKKCRIICERPYHALFMHIMLIRPTEEEFADFGEPDVVVINSGKFPANPLVDGVDTTTSVNLDLGTNQMVILGTEYAGEMKKGIFTYMMYVSMKEGGLPLHASMNQSATSDECSLFFGLSGTGKTTLSADPERRLIGDDEHVWVDDGCFNIEGGCYAKCLDLDPKREFEIYNAIKHGALLENVVFNDRREPLYKDKSITENTRCAYPLEHIPGAIMPAAGGHPSHVIMLTCDASGVLPPVSRLTPEQASYHFLSGYTAKVGGTEAGSLTTTPTFSACFGGPFLVYHPMEYAKRLADRLKEHKTEAWLVNTGWTGGDHNTGKRIDLPVTRLIIDKIHDGTLIKNGKFSTLPEFELSFCSECDGLPTEVLTPNKGWADQSAYKTSLQTLAAMFKENFSKYASKVTAAVRSAGPSD